MANLIVENFERLGVNDEPAPVDGAIRYYYVHIDIRALDRANTEEERTAATLAATGRANAVFTYMRSLRADDPRQNQNNQGNAYELWRVPVTIPFNWNGFMQAMPINNQNRYEIKVLQIINNNHYMLKFTVHSRCSLTSLNHLRENPEVGVGVGVLYRCVCTPNQSIITVTQRDVAPEPIQP